MRILELMDEAMTSVCGPPLDGTVRLGLPEDFASSRLAPALASFIQRNPGVDLVISTGLSGDLSRSAGMSRTEWGCSCDFSSQDSWPSRPFGLPTMTAATHPACVRVLAILLLTL